MPAIRVAYTASMYVWLLAHIHHALGISLWHENWQTLCALTAMLHCAGFAARLLESRGITSAARVRLGWPDVHDRQNGVRDSTIVSCPRSNCLAVHINVLPLPSVHRHGAAHALHFTSRHTYAGVSARVARTTR
jgi:hypothetical protein